MAGKCIQAAEQRVSAVSLDYPQFFCSAGKSTLMVALLRLVELSSGSITIDDVDIKKVGLKKLR